MWERAPWSIVTFVAGADGPDECGAMTADGTVLRHPVLAPFVGAFDLLQHWTEVEVSLRSLDLDAGSSVETATLRAPIRYPRKVLGAGANYASHVAEMKVDPVPPPDDPFFFVVPPTTCVVGPGEAVRIPANADAKVDWEVELAAVIGTGGRFLDREAARSAVAGWTVVNDISARGLMWKDDAPSPFHLNWLQQKARDTFFPMGPGVVPHWLVPDAHDLRMGLWHNDHLEQESTTADMLVDSYDLIAAASQHVTLEPGDVIATGTPAGVGFAKGRFLQPGDRVVAEIELLGRLENPIVDERQGAST